MSAPLVLRLDAATLSDLARIRAFVLDGAERLGADSLAADDLVIAIDEAATNVIRYGYRDRAGPITVELERDGSALAMRLVDEAPVFDPTTQWPEPNLELDIGERPFGGMGIHLMRTSVDRLVHASRGQNGNNLTFFKELTQNEGSVPG
jgi:anti-sigma regulatory factor (Ser/Thr protein kinase)